MTKRKLIDVDQINTAAGQAFFAERSAKYFAACKTCNGTCEVMERNEFLEKGWRSTGKEITEPIMTPAACPLCLNFAWRLERFCNKFFFVVPTRYQGCLFSKLVPSPKSVVPMERQKQDLSYLHTHPEQSTAFFGPAGSGKTTVMTAMFGSMVWRETGLWLPTSTVYLMSTKELLDQYQDYVMRGYDKENPADPPRLGSERIRTLASKGIRISLFLEEVDKVKQTDARMANLFETVDALYSTEGQLVISSNLTAVEFENQFGQQFARRVAEWCKVISYFERG